MPATDAVYALLSAHAPDALAAAEAFLAQSPDGTLDPNDRSPGDHAALLAAAAIQHGAVPLARFDPLLRRAVLHTQGMDNPFATVHDELARIVRLIRPIPAARREQLVRDHRGYLAWSAARLSETLTPAIASLVAWKLADLRERVNSKFGAPEMTRPQRALLRALGAVAVPPLVAALAAGPADRRFLVEGLGETACPEAAVPLVKAAADSSVEVSDLARQGLEKLVCRGHRAAVLAAASTHRRARRKRLRAAAAQALLLADPDPATVDDWCSRTDATIANMLRAWRASEPDPGRAQWHALRGSVSPERMALVDDRMRRYDTYGFRVEEVMRGWPLADRVAAAGRLASGDHSARQKVLHLNRHGLLADAAPAVCWAAMERLSAIESAFRPADTLAILEELCNAPPTAAVLDVLWRQTGHPRPLLRYLCARDRFLDDFGVHRVLVYHLGDRSASRAQACEDALGRGGVRAREALQAGTADPTARVRKRCARLLAALPASPPTLEHTAPLAGVPAPPPAGLSPELPTCLGGMPGSPGLYELGLLLAPPSATVDGRDPSTVPSALAKIPDGVRYLGLYRLSNDAIRAAVKHQSAECVEVVDCEGFDEGAFAACAALPRLRRLRLYACEKHLSARVLGRLPRQLEAIELVGRNERGVPPWLRDESLSDLADQGAMRILLLRHHLDITALTQLPALPRLRLLSLAGCPISLNDDDIDALARQPALRGLVLSHEPSSGPRKPRARINDAGIARLQALPALEHLRLNGLNKLNGSGIEALSGHPGLRWLSLGGCWGLQRAAVMAAVATMPNMRILNLSELAGLGAAELAPLAGCAQLTALKLTARSLDDAAIDVLCRIPTLKHLEIVSSASGGVPLQPEQLARLGVLPHLTSLRLQMRPLTRHHVDALLSLRVSRLQLSPDRALAPAVARRLLSMPRLQTLVLQPDPQKLVPALQGTETPIRVTTGYPPDTEDGIPLAEV